MKEKDTLYARWLSGELHEEEIEELRKSGAIQELEQIVNLTNKAQLPPYDLEAGLKRFKQAHQATQPSPKVRRLSRRIVLGVAASFLLLISVFFFQMGNSQRFYAEVGTNYEHLFEDGTKIKLNDASSFRFQKRNWKKERNLKLNGEAFFEVEKGVPFIVKTNKGTVEVLGTSFNVRAWGEQLEVTCFTGSVRVKGFGNDHTLSPGEGIVLLPDGSTRKEESDKTEPSWTSGLSTFKSAALGEVFKELERQYGFTIQNSAPDRSFSGAFEHNDLEKALELICKPLNLDYSIDKAEKLIQIE